MPRPPAAEGRGRRRTQLKRDPLGGSSRTPLHHRKAMKAFVVDRYKSKSAVRLGEMPEPEVRDHDVLVQVHAASLNQLDSKIRDGEFKLILPRSEEHTSELQSQSNLVCRLLLEKKQRSTK